MSSIIENLFALVDSTLAGCHPSTDSAWSRLGLPAGWPNTSRLEAITLATDNLNRCVRERGKLTAQGDRWGVTLGEMDWLEELHRLLYEENTVGHLNDMYGADDRSAVGAAIEARKREREASAVRDEAFGPVELLVGPNPNTKPTPQVTARYLAEKGLPYDRAGVVEDACKAFARNTISGNEFERRIKEARANGEPTTSVFPPSARYCSCLCCVQGRKRLDLVPDSLDPRELVPDSLDPRPLANWNGEPVKLWSAPGKTEEILSAARPGIGGAPTRATTLPTDAAGRKEYPVASGFMDYFPDAIAAVSNLSKKGNDQHNPGQPLHWARGKSGDESDTMMRHFLQRGTLDTDGIRHTVKMAWRAMAILQKEIEGEK